MLADVIRNVPTEVDVLNGTIVQMAKKVGTSAPLNRSIVSRLSRLQQKRGFSTIRIISSTKEMMEARRAITTSVGFVPTMGGLHRGHLDLVRAAAESCDKVVVSIYVNPTQFGPNEDFTKYPRTLPQDLHHLESLGLAADRLMVFAPSNLYGKDHFLYVIPEGGLNHTGEGVSRPGHFKGVATVVLKLFNIVRPTKAFFGQKDGQQCILVKALVRDFDLNDTMEVVICPTARAEDGLALSKEPKKWVRQEKFSHFQGTRNQYLNGSQRQQAPVLYEALCHVKSLIAQGGVSAAQAKEAFVSFIQRQSSGKDIVVQYISMASAETGSELSNDATLGAGLMISAAIQFKGFPLRLIDNVLIEEEKNKAQQHN
jgi:pantoate--beta-alanine ligase